MKAEKPSISPVEAASGWRERALAHSEIITDAWEVTKTYAGRIAEWVLFGCMVMNIIEILPGVTLWPAVSNLVLGMQVVMLDVGGFSLASMGQQAHEQGDEQAAKRASITGGLLIGIMMLTLLLVTVGLLWPDARAYTGMAEKGLILVRVVMTVVYGHVIHSLRRLGLSQQQAALSEVFTELSARISEGEARLTEQCRELVNRTVARCSLDFSEQVERTRSEHPTRSELARVAELVEAHSRLLSELAALPTQLEKRVQVQTLVQQEVQTAVANLTPECLITSLSSHIETLLQERLTVSLAEMRHIYAPKVSPATPKQVSHETSKIRLLSAPKVLPHATKPENTTVGEGSHLARIYALLNEDRSRKPTEIQRLTGIPKATVYRLVERYHRENPVIGADMSSETKCEEEMNHHETETAL
ncbi:MAG TPA: hypothetical protein VFQ30_04400 [Ktedonobacteraceae bacterium]|nr:hypothetical protein [Ktedonobacteraceae bacterium]